MDKVSEELERAAEQQATYWFAVPLKMLSPEDRQRCFFAAEGCISAVLSKPSEELLIKLENHRLTRRGTLDAIRDHIHRPARRA